MLEEISFFAKLPDDLRQEVEKIARPISLRKGAILFSPGEPARGFYAVLEGAIRVYRVSGKGKMITLEIVGPGSTFAEGSLFSDSYHCYAEALKDSKIHLITRGEFRTIIKDNARFSYEWIRVLSTEIINLRQRIEEISLKSPKERIISYLIMLADMQKATRVTLPSLRKAIATLLNMTQETFYRTVNELEKEGLIHLYGQEVDIPDLSLLEALLD
ncbi:MAG: Crp/Fnr family transcriptional regulator [Desulfobaccales bacterium]